MAKRIHIIWKNYDGWVIEEFMLEPRSKIEDRLTELQQAVDGAEYGTEIVKVIEGEELTFKTVEVVTRVKLNKN